MRTRATAPLDSVASREDERRGFAISPRSVRAAGVALGIAIAAFTFVSLAPLAYKSTATIGVDDASSTMAQVMTRAAADAVVSRTVISRAVASLDGTDLIAPDPTIFDRLGVAFGLNGAAGKSARLEALIAPAIRVVAGQVPGTVEITAQAEKPEQAARIADAVADAFTVDQADMAAVHRRRTDIASAKRLDALKADAVAARKQFAALGGTETDPSQLLANAANQTATAQARLDAIRGIMASGTPPLSDRRDIPQSVELLQNTYLDQVQQLAKARETLGDRHMTVTSLQDGVKRASQQLIAEWRRLSRLAEADLAKAHERERALAKPDTAADASRRLAYEEARRRVAVADDLLAKAQTVQTGAPADEHGFRVLLRASVSQVSVGFSFFKRVMLAGLAGLAVLIGSRLLARSVWPADPAVPQPKQDPAPAKRRGRKEAFFEAEDAEEQPEPREHMPLPSPEPRRQPVEHQAGILPSRALRAEMRRLLDRLEAIRPSYGDLPTVMVAANAAGLDTTTPAMALAQAASEAGRRVLVIETQRLQPALAAAVDPEAEPILIDAFGGLRVAMRADNCGETVYLAPSLSNGQTLAASLARQDETPIVEDLGAEFDLILVDGGRALDAAAQGWGADAYLRVGRVTSLRDDERFIETVGSTETAFLGTLIGATIHAKRTPRHLVEPLDEEADAAPMRASTAAHRPPPAQPQPARTPVRRKIAAR